MTSEGSFKPTVMFFGLTNFSVIFQTIMNEILWNLINTGEVANFIDNMIVGTEEEERHDEVIEEVVKRLAENDLYIKLEKYKWKIEEVGFLEVVIGLEQKFLRLTNYYRQFLKDFSYIAKPLYDLVKKDQKWNWIKRQKKMFKERFTKEPVLVALDLNKK